MRQNEQVNVENDLQIETYLKRLWPLNRSITGNAVRATHDILGELLDLERIEVPTGTKCFDWCVPDEWNVEDAYVLDPDGLKIIDFKDNNLHLVGYSTPFEGTLSLDDLQDHLYSLPQQPTAIPYITSYYEKRWGFCMAHEQRAKLKNGKYKVVIRGSLRPGAMTMSQAVLTGSSEKEVLLSTYTCHPSMANNELSGPVVLAFLYRRLKQIKNRRLTYRFLFVPETIGTIAYLSKFGSRLVRDVVAGYVATCAGTSEPFTYKRSRQGISLADRAAAYVLKRYTNSPLFLDFSPRGSDERQYCSPGFDLPVGVIARSIFGQYSEYHTSLDNLDFISAEAIKETVSVYFSLLMLLDKNNIYERTEPFCEPNLGKRGLYPTEGAQKKSEFVNALMWVLNMCDGKTDVLKIAERSSVDFWDLVTACERAEQHGLIRVSQDKHE